MLPKDKKIFKHMMDKLDYSLLEVTPTGSIKAVSSRLVEMLGYSKEEMRNKSMQEFISYECFKDLFMSSHLWENPIKNYRAVFNSIRGKRILVQISGYSEKAEDSDELVYKMLVQELKLDKTIQVDTGDFQRNLKAHKMLRKYISTPLFERAVGAVNEDLEYIPNESRVMTFCFADLVSFTSLSENTEPEEIVEMLNLSIGATSSTILHNGGHVDKIMGDSIFAVFEQPLSAIMAAIEIQKQFNLMNFFRLKNNQDEVLLRVGINTGPSVLASIGSADFMEMTYIGDAVNTASRLEKAAVPGAVLVSDSTLATVRDSVEVSEVVDLKVKGKAEELKAHYVTRVNFEGPRGAASLGLDDEMF